MITRELVGVSRSDAGVAPTGVGGGLEARITWREDKRDAWFRTRGGAAKGGYRPRRWAIPDTCAPDFCPPFARHTLTSFVGDLTSDQRTGGQQKQDPLPAPPVL